jgi:Icc-related predicted phosphoesterase
MRVLAFSDLHRDEETAAKLVEMSAEADLVIGAGDFASIHEGLDRIIAALSPIDTQTLLVPGNNETVGALRDAASRWPAAAVLHGETQAVDGIEFFGLGGGIPTTPWKWSFDVDDSEAAVTLASAPAGGVFILHSPPHGHADASSAGDHLGSPAILAAIESKQPRLAVCGHIHESWGARSMVGETEVANLGPAGAWFEL